MKISLQFLAMLGVNFVPALGWFTGGWSAGTMLVIYWFENVVACLFVSAKIRLHRRWAPSHGHFKYKARTGDKRGAGGSFLGGYMVTSLIFSGAHGIFLGVILTILTLNGEKAIVGVQWNDLKIGCGCVLLFLTVDFLAGLPGLRHKSFLWIEQMANRNLSRVVLVHLSIIFGMFGVALTGATKAFFGVFVVLKTLNDLSSVLPQWDPAEPPKWLCWAMDKVPGKKQKGTFAEFWARDKAGELARREANEKRWKKS